MILKYENTHLNFFIKPEIVLSQPSLMYKYLISFLLLNILSKVPDNQTIDHTHTRIVWMFLKIKIKEFDKEIHLDV